MAVNAQRLSLLIEDIRTAITSIAVDSATTAAVTYRTIDRHDKLEHLGIYLWVPQSRATGDNARGPGEKGDFIEDRIELKLRYNLRHPDGQKASFGDLYDREHELLTVVAGTRREVITRWAETRRVVDPNKPGWVTSTMTFRTFRMDRVRI